MPCKGLGQNDGGGQFGIGKSGTTLGDTGLNTQLSRPHGVRIAPDRQLDIADTYNDRVLRGEYRWGTNGPR